MRKPHLMFLPYLKIAFDGAKLGISRVCFSIIHSWKLCFVGSSSLAIINGDDPRTTLEDFTVPPEWILFPSNLVYSLHEAKLFLNTAQVNASGLSDLCRTGWAISGCDVFILRSCFEIESDWIKLIGDMHQKPVVPIGLLSPSLQAINKAEDSSSDNNIWVTISGCKVVLMGQSKLYEIDVWIGKFLESIDVSRSGYESDFVTSLSYELGWL
ncbi:hypothetical protein QYF36_016047 [Acer negundo]|nr:hypothetical protein QYF36_016047 [Acer negundo]